MAGLSLIMEKKSENEGKLFAYLLSQKLASRNASNDPVNMDCFLATTKAWFQKLASSGHFHEILKFMETALEVFSEAKTEILCITAHIFLQHEYVLEAIKLFRLASTTAADNFDIHEDLDQCYNCCLQRWHFRMLNDLERNHPFYNAIKKAVDNGYKELMDIGSGTGILRYML